MGKVSKSVEKCRKVSKMLFLGYQLGFFSSFLGVLFGRFQSGYAFGIYIFLAEISGSSYLTPCMIYFKKRKERTTNSL